jgi:hypothetical protein
MVTLFFKNRFLRYRDRYYTVFWETKMGVESVFGSKVRYNVTIQNGKIRKPLTMRIASLANFVCLNYPKELYYYVIYRFKTLSCYSKSGE